MTHRQRDPVLEEVVQPFEKRGISLCEGQGSGFLSVVRKLFLERVAYFLSSFASLPSLLNSPPVAL